MIKDVQLKLIFIPLLGILIPLVSGIAAYEHYTSLQLVFANLYFILTSFVIWGGSNWIHMKLRLLFTSNHNPFVKIISISLVSTLYGAAAGGSMTMIWFRFSKEVFSFEKLLSFIVFTSMAVILFTLVYEILFLSKERELDTKIVDELDKDRIRAEMTALQNELDPHFIFNSLNTLNQLIITEPESAYLYNTKLAQVFKYLLVNKNSLLVPLSNEMEFIENYFSLLRVRHEDKLELETNILSVKDNRIMVPPCALQTLIENAIKHNEFTNENPLKIIIWLNGNYLKISNQIRPKPYLAASTNIGLKNLNSRYLLLCNKNIEIENNQTTFLVKLPVICNS
jgi:sensor histidine kinase YesM